MTGRLSTRDRIAGDRSSGGESRPRRDGWLQPTEPASFGPAGSLGSILVRISAAEAPGRWAAHQSHARGITSSL